MANTTIYDVAGAAKVSLATVSRVMNNPEKVNPETREKVLKAIKELGYRPNAIAKGLASRKTTTVGIIVSDISRAATSQLVGGIIDIAQKYDYAVKLFSMDEESDKKEVMRRVVAEQVDGILFLNDELNPEEMELVLNHIQDAQIPVVLCNACYEEKSIPSVAIDYEQATYDVTNKLLSSGKKKVFFATTTHRYAINGRKLAGYEKAMKEAGLEANIVRTSGDVSINTLHFTELLKNNEIEALIAVRDSIAVSFMNVAREEFGKKIPKDISIVGFQNTKYAILASPALTSIDIPVYDIGAASMQLLTKLMNNETVDDKNLLLPHRIIERQTTEN